MCSNDFTNNEEEITPSSLKLYGASLRKMLNFNFFKTNFRILSSSVLSFVCVECCKSSTETTFLSVLSRCSFFLCVSTSTFYILLFSQSKNNRLKKVITARKIKPSSFLTRSVDVDCETETSKSRSAHIHTK